ncbi:Ribosomal RNA small subunit methyltransferase I [Hartmannibacter diazotrophicus]|uniref:Ribosomal RNA small subunit methyltransferase I n=1 Tax=Hartmannibacter diazotrophicus TaxID=1482074 RepID=A0A2C9CZP7_9HYPH|nr:16S rRNA (cytidine(1402)-2'-O)-methyltransferase [Hartmannibacter diazotrophicus]SON53627.1 Ribosomal RNA small subunit methyltransferase I [Hartmannibacter diazotrophicus]
MPSHQDTTHRDAPAREERSYAIDGRTVSVRPLEPGLYPVATPIGNLADISLRALEVLAGADLIACEDTRVSRVLLDRYGIHRPLVAYHEHNAARERPRLTAAMTLGKAVALISDAGTPLISDPGYKLVEATLEEGHKVVPIPGPSAILTAIVASGLPTDCFLFGGFLPSRQTARRQRLAEFAQLGATLVFYESPHRAAETLADMADVLGADRPGALARELTKRFEEVRRGPLKDLAEGAQATPPRGEIVLLAGPYVPGEASEDDLDALLIDALSQMPMGKAAAEIAKVTGRPRKEVYARAQTLKALVPTDAPEEDEAP